MKMRKRRINKLLLAGLLLFIITGCSTTKHLPEDELLYIGTPTPKLWGTMRPIMETLRWKKYKAH